MLKLNVADLTVSSFAPAPGEGGDELFLKDTDPRACPYTQGWNCNATQYSCATDAAGCETGGGYNC